MYCSLLQLQVALNYNEELIYPHRYPRLAVNVHIQSSQHKPESILLLSRGRSYGLDRS